MNTEQKIKNLKLRVKERQLKKANHDMYHHPIEKIKQLEQLNINNHDTVLEVFAGQGNLTKWYQNKVKEVTPLSREKNSKINTGNSYDYIHKLRYEKKKYSIIDIDGYGYPSKFFPLVFEMMTDNAKLIFTFPRPGVKQINNMTEEHFRIFYKSDRPSIGDVTGVLTDMALREWYLLSLLNVVKIKNIYRFVYSCVRQKANVMCNMSPTWSKKLTKQKPDDFDCHIQESLVINENDY